MTGLKLSEAQKKISTDIKKNEVAIAAQQSTLNRLNDIHDLIFVKFFCQYAV
ncbi:hypothetical protein [Moraxella sp.]|uniref:hypothetical protein n=1 Tax=Moraxella sp. TaxID=479 RepID=UPI0026DC8D7B|nr:hypothetical protein [Moraxella sp.]MDO4895249.1 hypothetical protein [Moraxella sp.]